MKKITILFLLALVSQPVSAGGQRADSIASLRARDSVLARLRLAEEQYRKALLEAQSLGVAAERMSTSEDLAKARQALEEARTIQMYAARYITRKELDTRLGRARADSAVRSLAQAETERRAAEVRKSNATSQYEFERRASGRLPSVSLGFALVCSDCATTSPEGITTWSFSNPPVIGAVERGSVAERMGIRRGDTLRTIDDLSLTTRQGGERLGSIQPGRTVKLGWSRNGVAHTASITIPRDNRSASDTTLRHSQVIGNANVEIRGNASWTRDANSGALRVTVEGASVTVTPR